jgi:hypothetical protein
VGVDVSKDRLDVCLQWSEPESREEVFAAAHDEAGIDTLVSGLVKERPMCWCSWKPLAASSEQRLGLWPPSACR